MSVYKKIKNTTHQGLEVIIKTPSGQFDHIWVPSKQSVVVPTDSITDLIRVAEQRQMVKITNA
jgi:hypothetical protein|tara:strand:- start:2263 stop:2451 length:189 start_codon:yes stop_codon:yes gene_type:complete